MADFAGLSVVGIILGVLALVAIIVAIVVWAVRCAVARRRAAEATKETSTGLGAGLLDREAAGVAVAEPKREEALCAICKGPLAGGEKLRRLRACGHVYHAECVDPWLQRKAICPLCRAKVEVSRTDIVHAMV